MLVSRSYSLHGVFLHVETTAMEAIREVHTLLSPFASDLKEDPDCVISISPDYPENHEFPPEVRVLWDGVLPEGIRATYRGDETLRWIKLYGFSLSCFSLNSRHAKISYKPGAEWCLISG